MKLIQKHIWPDPFQKMPGKYAVQVFSKSMYAAIITANATDQLNSDAAVQTELFITKIHDSFDCLDARYTQNANPLNRSMKNGKPKPSKTLFNIFCIEFKNFGWKSLLPQRLNQDPLENSLRNMSGYNPQPTI